MGTLVFSVESAIAEFKLSSQTFSIGRSDTCDVSLPGRGLVVNTVRLVGEDTDGCSPTHRSTAHLWERKITKRILGYGSSFQIGPYTVSLQKTTNLVGNSFSLSPKHHEFIVAVMRHWSLNARFWRSYTVQIRGRRFYLHN